MANMNEYEKKYLNIKKRYSRISSDGDILELSQLSTCSKNELKDLYTSNQITRKQYMMHINRFGSDIKQIGEENGF